MALALLATAITLAPGTAVILLVAIIGTAYTLGKDVGRWG